ncbi:MAG: amidohydrolase family protein [Candidatus Heimdallarchaeota archaeon]|nr:amidohydrolase family protein [Candidatus Heimdallarchaeota archaeon]MCK5298535.1 amidohydrolase family protein [Candidatus Heimdallarchaeota archaeon]
MKAILCGKIIPVTKDPIENGHILIDDKGKIKKVGKGFDVPKDAEIIDAKKWVAFPGIIDVHCHAAVFEEEVGLGLQDGNECTDPITPHVRVLDAINPVEKGMKRAIGSGVTCVCIAPGSGNVVGGQMTTIKTHGRIVDDMVIQEVAGMKCAFGENPKRVYGGMQRTPSTRMGNLGVFRQLMMETQNYMNKWDEYKKKLKQYKEDSKEYEKKKKEDKDKDLKKPVEPTIPDKNIKYDAMVPVFKKEIPLRAHAHQDNDIISAVRLAKEFDVNVTIEHCTYGHKIADFLAENKIPAIVGPTFGFRTKIELKDMTWKTYGILNKKGVLVALTSDHPVVPLQEQTVYAAIAHREGLSKQGAYEIITINGAKILGLDDRIGSIEAGKDADIALWNGDPLLVHSKVQKVLIDGKIIYDIETVTEELF